MLTLVRNSLRIKKLPSRYAVIVMPLILSVLMSGIVSAVSTLMNAGRDQFAATWPHAWAASWLIAFPSLLLLLPVVRRIVGAIVEQRA
ncbi:DUF2798 domain-containing protein [Sinorhizobium garamanticum]|uniref:DUF2798 domain-containing protein n=1 Tax=Sinorhizobium garamanticum TaxID=680247 RepID=A0ABY8D7D2_9HYPH|nr:DUF2798 domain-containing protein [Sinorhizobium garamanticum]WEX86791.1 DUF2798 domain-containing protein [Sinorhizobium garamanticum]